MSLRLACLAFFSASRATQTAPVVPVPEDEAHGASLGKVFRGRVCGGFGPMLFRFLFCGVSCVRLRMSLIVPLQRSG